ncbi:MAG: ATP-dependent zinc metalloprotease FtsH [Rikenellaceae bacterium]
MAQNKKPANSQGKPPINMMWVWAALLGGIMLFNIFGSDTALQKEITTQYLFETIIPRGELEKATVVNRENVEIFLTPNAVKKYQKITEYKGLSEEGPQFYMTIGDLSLFEEKYDKVKSEQTLSTIPPLEFERREGGFWETVLSFLPILIMVFFLFFMFRRVGGGSGAKGGGSNMFNVGKSKAKLFDKNNAAKVTFKDVAGLQEAKVEVMEIVDFLKSPKKYKDLGGKIPKGALLVGPPGTGKTLLAKAVAGEAGVSFFSMSGSDFVEMFVGVGASRVRDLFATAKAKSPCIVFIDEIDAIGRARGKNGGFSGNDERENTLNQLLTEMDGFGTDSGVIVLAATNRADILDKALLRAGRFDRQIHVDLPEKGERGEIFNVYLKKLKLTPGMDTEFLAQQTPGFSGADIANTCNEAALIAARANKKFIEKQDFLDAVDRIVGGLERKSKVLKPAEKRAIAFHEAGHATVSWFLKYAHPLLKVTIIPRGRALGAAWYIPDERQITTREQMMHEMASLLGGRVSEELTFGEISSGALNDLERATKQAYAMVAYYGMSDKVGNRSYYDSQSGEMSFVKPYSEGMAELIDSEVKVFIDESYETARTILSEQAEGLAEVAELLISREVIFAEDLERIFGAKVTADAPEGSDTTETPDNTCTADTVDNADVKTPSEETKPEDIEPEEEISVAAAQSANTSESL